jgi:phage gpG-like protein
MWAALEGADALDVKLATLPAEMQALLEAKARGLAERLGVKVREEKLSGGVLQTQSGALKASIVADVSTADGTLSAIVGSIGDVKYAAIQEYGGRTAAHQILPDKSSVLAFLAGGATRFARSAEHPGSTLPARAYLSSSLGEMRDEIVTELSSVANQAWET